MKKIYIDQKKYFELTAEFVKNVGKLYRDFELKHLCIVAVARGGLIPGQLLSYHISLRQPGISIPVFVHQPLFRVSSFKELYREIKESGCNEIIIVDELSDTGKTLLELYNAFDGGEFVRTAVLLKKTNPNQVYSPEIWVDSVPNDWVEFFYDK